MDSVYLISMIVGGFFVLLSIFGGDSEAEADVALDADVDADFDVDIDADFDADFDVDADVDFDAGSGVSSGSGLVDLLSVRALFLFAAFFGLTGTLLTWLDASPFWTLVASVLTGLVIGLGGNFVIKRVGYRTVSSAATGRDIRGTTARVLVPFEGAEKGKVVLVTRGQRLQLVARSFDDENAATFNEGDEVVVVNMDGSIAEVVKPT